MIGTEKQIAWAEKIKAASVANWEAAANAWEAKARRHTEKGLDSAPAWQRQAEAARSIIAAAVEIEGASAWIDARRGSIANPEMVIAMSRPLSFDERVALTKTQDIGELRDLSEMMTGKWA